MLLFQCQVGVTSLVINGVENTILSGGSLDDGYWSGITIPFNFNFYGNTFSSVVIGTNGNIHFGTPTTGGYGSTFPNTSNPNFTIAGVFADLDLRLLPGSVTTGSLNYFTEGASPNRRFVVNYDSVGFYNSGSPQLFYTSFQIILFETSNNIEVHTIALTNTTSSKLQGVENGAGNFGTPVNWTKWNYLLDRDFQMHLDFQDFSYSWSPSNLFIKYYNCKSSCQ
ncbi:MAG: hypothetical protein IPO72_18320 [Saprospiraceae bacterium]|nr:hypothetical protein [Candidatus Vicinibacter affinis]